MSEAKDGKQEWLYSGPESTVDREAYLTGRKLDKNFELYGVDKSKEKEGGISAVRRSRRQEPERLVTELEVDTVRTEDPLVAIKLREEKAKKELISNPVKMKKLQGLVMAAMEKKMAKALRKAAKKERKAAKREKRDKEEKDKRRRDHSEEDDRKRSSRRDSRSPPRRHKRSPSPRHKRSRKASPSPERSRSHRSGWSERQERESKPLREPKKEPSSPPPKPSRARHDSSDSSSSSDGEGPSKGPLQGPAMPAALPGSDSEEEERKAKAAKFSGFGLVTKEGEKVKVDTKASGGLSRALPEIGKVDRKALEPERQRFDKAQKRERLSEEEMERRRKEMMDNASWRDSQRDHNLKRYKAREEQEERDEKKRTGSGFVKSMHASAVAAGDLGQRLSQAKHKLQRTEAAYNSNSYRK